MTNSFDNYKTFIETATCTTEIFRDVNVIEDTTDHLLEKLPDFSDACKCVSCCSPDMPNSKCSRRRLRPCYAAQAQCGQLRSAVLCLFSFVFIFCVQ
jgi:hypothetical protein